MKYKTLAELKAAYDSGELPKECPLILDNDCVGVHIPLTPDYGEQEKVFGGFDYGPNVVLEEALDMLGIPWEHC